MENTVLRNAAMLNPAEVLPPYDAIMEKYGFDAVCTISEVMGGMTIYVPKVRTIFSRCLEEEARKEFNGNNSALISKKYGFTERHMRRLMGLG
jgi:Mor family transcriptional regulator